MNLDNVELKNVIRIWVSFESGQDWVWDSTKEIESHDPMDRGGPFHIHNYVESEGDKWYLFAVVDCAFLMRDLVRGDNLEHAYEQYIDWAADNRGIKMEEDSEDCNYTSDGIPVDTDNITGQECKLIRIEMRG